jgi:hypothetical protein
MDQLLADIQSGASDLYFSKEYIQQHYVDNDTLT